MGIIHSFFKINIYFKKIIQKDSEENPENSRPNDEKKMEIEILGRDKNRRLPQSLRTYD